MPKAELEDVVVLTKEMMHEYFKGNPQLWFEHLSPQSIFVATGEKIIFGAENIKKELKRYALKGRGKIYSDDYHLIPINHKSAIVVEQTVTGTTKDDDLRIASVHSFVYKLIGAETKLIFEHTSYEYYKESELQNNTSLMMDRHTFQIIKHLLMDNPKHQKLCFQNGSKTLYLDKNIILYIEGDGHHSQIHCINKVVSCTQPLYVLKEELKNDFYQIHRSYLINIHYLIGISCYEVELFSGIRLPIPASKYRQVKSDLEKLLNRPLTSRKKKKK